MAKSMVVAYAEKFDVPVSEVVAWVNQYVKGPWVSDMLPNIELSEAERMDSIKRYITAEAMAA